MWFVVAIITGIIVGAISLFLGFMINMGLYPIPQDLQSNDVEAMNNFIKSLPPKAFIVKAIGNTVACFSASLVGSLVAEKGKYQAGIIAGSTILVYIIFSDFKFEYPTAFVITDLCSGLCLGFLGILIAGRSSED